MNINIRRHKVLQILSIKRINGELGNRTEPLEVSFDEIYKKLKCNEAVLIFSKLFSEKEIAYHNAFGVKGLYLTKEGLVAFSNKKYIKEYYSILVGYLKDFVQIFIPILSLCIAFLALSLKHLDTEKSLNNRIDSLKIDVYKIKNKSVK